MFGLDNRFHKIIQEKLQLRNLILVVIQKKLLSLGVCLTKAQLKLLKKQLESDTSTIKFTLTDKQIAKAEIKTEPELEAAIHSALSDIVSETIEFANNVFEELPDLIDKITDDIATDFFRKFRRSYKFSLAEYQQSQANFEKDLQQTWGNAINQLEVLLILAQEALEYVINQSVNNVDNSYKYGVLKKLYARACQITGEIIVLLRAGYADGAEARWRSLYEITVVASFIFEHSDNVAKQYLLHDIIEEYKALNQRLNLWPELKQDEEFYSYFNELKNKKEKLIKEYGDAFGKDYGWSASSLNDHHPTFEKIEKKVTLSYFRPNYKEASYNVHAGVRGTFYRLGLPPNYEAMFLSNASDFGLAKPGWLSSISLAYISVSLLQSTEIIDSAVIIKIISKQSKLTGKEFWKIHNHIMKNLEK